MNDHEQSYDKHGYQNNDLPVRKYTSAVSTPELSALNRSFAVRTSLHINMLDEKTECGYMKPNIVAFQKAASKRDQHILMNQQHPAIIGNLSSVSRLMRLDEKTVDIFVACFAWCRCIEGESSNHYQITEDQRQVEVV